MTNSQREEFIAIRKILDSFIAKIADSPVEVNESIIIIRKWHPGIYNVGVVRLYEEIPYKYVQAHDSTDNEAWNPAATPALWMQYHRTSPETARPWIRPTGAQDIYKVGEYMIWADNTIMKCVFDTNFSSDEHPLAWKII